jgi:protein-S-isoprenylcysteine O-methyltransferase Ste14
VETRTAAVATVAFAVFVPGTVIGLIPRWLRARERHRRGGGGPPARAEVAAAGSLLTVCGTVAVGDAFVRFVRARGTPAPVAETEELVVTGPYRYARNPQYLGVIATVAGLGLRWRSPAVLVYAALLGVAFDAWVRGYEEPRLRHRFGDAYAAYTRTVPRWGAVPISGPP